MGQERDGAERELGWLRQQVADWRARRTKHGPMPGGLWQAAVELAQQYGVAEVARDVQLDHGSLKRRVEEAQAESSDATGFVELSATDVFGGAGTVVEVVDDGVQLTVRLEPGAALDVIELVRSFREAAR